MRKDDTNQTPEEKAKEDAFLENPLKRKAHKQEDLREKPATIAFKIEPGFKKKANMRARKSGMTLSTYLRVLVCADLNKEEPRS